MTGKRDLIITILATFCLTATLFMIIPSRGASSYQYDPWKDLNDDGKIDGKDIAWVAKLYNTQGTPINKTALLLELQARIDSLNASVVQLQERTNELETQLIILNATKLGKPGYDSGWYYSPSGSDWYHVFTHGLGTTNVLVYLIGLDSSTGLIHQHYYGGVGGNSLMWWGGVWWHDLTSYTITVSKYADDSEWDYVRVIMWKIPSS